MWGRFFPQALNIIAGSEKPARASGHPHGAGFWIIEDCDLSGQACSLPKRDEDTAGWGKVGLLGGKRKGGSAQVGCSRFFSEPREVRNSGVGRGREHSSWSQIDMVSW